MNKINDINDLLNNLNIFENFFYINNRYISFKIYGYNLKKLIDQENNIEDNILYEGYLYIENNVVLILYENNRNVNIKNVCSEYLNKLFEALRMVENM